MSNANADHPVAVEPASTPVTTPATSVALSVPTPHFALLLEALKDAYKEFVDAYQKIAGILLIVIGWFASNRNPLQLLCDWPSIVPLALGSTAGGSILLYILFRGIYCRGCAVRERLERLEPQETVLYSRYELTVPMFGIGFFGQLLLLIGVFGLIACKYLPTDHLATCTEPPSGHAK